MTWLLIRTDNKWCLLMEASHQNVPPSSNPTLGTYLLVVIQLSAWQGTSRRQHLTPMENVNHGCSFIHREGWEGGSKEAPTKERIWPMLSNNWTQLRLQLPSVAIHIDNWHHRPIPWLRINAPMPKGFKTEIGRKRSEQRRYDKCN
jgi:hypothetical protein